MSPNTYSLISVSARPSKRAIEVTFANSQKRMLKHYPFFPSFYLPRTSTTVFEKLLAAQTNFRHQTLLHSNSIQVMCGTWEELKQLANVLYTQTGYYPALVEPERQFLLAQNWRYFQAFDEKLSPIPNAFHDVPVPGLAETLYPTLLGLKKHAPSMEKTLAQRILLSHELFLPYTDVPISLSEQVEAFLTNSLFAQHMPAPHEQGKPINSENWTGEQRALASELAFQTPLFTEGKCSCCKPTSIFHQHVHAGSMIDAAATQDGVYVHTNNYSLSTSYHESHSEKEKRIAHAKEWGLSTLPIGPLRRGEKISLPLRDAIEGQRQGTLNADQPPLQATWECRKESYALQKVRVQLKERALLHSTIHSQLVQPYLSKYQLAYTVHAAQNPQVGLHAASEKTLQEWFQALPNHLLRGETVWRGTGYTTLIQAGIGE